MGQLPAKSIVDPGHARRAAGLLATVVTMVQLGIVSGQQVQEAPTFRAVAELVSIDLQIVATHGAAMREFIPSDFVVEVGGRKRAKVFATRLHSDEGAVVRDLQRAPGSVPACVFGLNRRKNLTTVHYLIGVERTEADRPEIKNVRVTLADRAFQVVWVLWRSPIRRAG